MLVLLEQLLPVASQHVERWANLGIKSWIEASIAAVPKGEYQGACGFLCLCSRKALGVVVRHQRPAVELRVRKQPLYRERYQFVTNRAGPWGRSEVDHMA